MLGFVRWRRLFPLNEISVSKFNSKYKSNRKEKKMGIKNFFKVKPKSQDEFEQNIHDKMEEKNMPTKRMFKQREKQFGDFNQYAKQYNEISQKKKYSPFPEDDLNAVDPELDNSNPYAAAAPANPYGGNARNSNPYGNPYGATGAASAAAGNPNDATFSTGNYNPYSKQTETHANPYQSQLPQQVQQQLPSEELDLNDDTYHDNENLNDLNNDAYRSAIADPVLEETEEERAQREEDEEVIKIKDQMRDEKIKSIGSLRNTLQMAREAETSGLNTMGMLGAQSETLNDIESNLSLAEKQQGIAKEKIAELHHYNRNILKPNIKNPFTKSRRLREQEQQIKNDHIQTKIEREQQRREMAQSTNRVNNSLKINGEGEIQDSVALKYRREKYKNEAKQYQFENDSEDDQLEMEIAENLDEVAKISGRLKKLAVNQGEEIDRQNYRMREIEEKTDKLDINTHLNTASLSRAR